MSRVDFERDYWDNAAKDPEVITKYMSTTNTNDCLNEIVPYLKKGNILELGCGVGRLINNMPLENCHFIGVDISTKLLDIAANEGKSELILCNGREIPVEDESIDSVFSILVFQHLPTNAVKKYINEVSRILKVEGVFRFQFIEGFEHDNLSHHHLREIISGQLKFAGFNIANIKKGLVHPLWTWVTAIKETKIE